MQPRRILLVDDEREIRADLEKRAAVLGYKVFVAKSRTEANFLIKQQAFDLAVLDIMLPDGSGLQISQDLKAKFPHIYCIIITGHAALDNAIEAINQGVDAYLVKPFSGEQFDAAVQQGEKILKLREDHQRLLEENLSTRQFFENLLNSTSEAIFVVNLDFSIQYCNLAAEKFLNSTQDVLLNQNLQFYIEDGYKVLNHIYQQLMLSKRVGSYRVNLRHGSEEKYEVNLSADFLHNHQDHIEGIVIAMEMTSLQNELFNRILRKEKFATLNNLAGALAHEIRNPINILSGRMQLLKKEITDPEYQKTFSIINRQVDRISEIIKLLVKFNTNKDDTIPETFPLTEFFEDFSQKYQDQNPSIDFHPNPHPSNQDVLVEANRIQFEDAFTYLFTAISEIGKTDLKVEILYKIGKSYAPKAQFTIQLEFDTFIPLDNIFEPFKFLSQQDSQSSLGLAIMHTIFSNYGVKLSTDQLQNKNSVLILQFPIAEIVESATSETPSRKSSNKGTADTGEQTVKPRRDKNR